MSTKKVVTAVAVGIVVFGGAAVASKVKGLSDQEVATATRDEAPKAPLAEGTPSAGEAAPAKELGRYVENVHRSFD